MSTRCAHALEAATEAPLPRGVRNGNREGPRVLESERKTGVEPAIRPSRTIRVRERGLDLLRREAA